MDAPHNWGATPKDVAAPRPCDELVIPGEQLFRAVTIHASKELVFRWLCQMRVAPYSYDFIDNLGRRSPQYLTPGLDQLAVGQTVMTIFTLASFEPNQHLTLRISTPRARRLFGDLACTYAVETGETADQTRLIVKIVLDHSVQPSLLGRAVRRFLPWGDLLMMRKQLLTLKKLAERDARKT